MNSRRAGKRVNVLFYLLTGYILLQFFWWAYLLVELNLELYQNQDPETGNIKVLMIVGEGIVFFIFLLAGIYITQRTIKKEIKLVRQQRNFLLSITHELKTPLAAIKLSMDTLTKRENLDKDQRNLLQNNVRDNTQRLNLLIGNVLLATQMEAGKDILNKSEVNLSELTSKIVSRIGQTYAGVKMNVDIDTDITGLTDIHNYESIVTNLIENGLKYGGGKPLAIKLFKESDKVVIRVSDLGSGIPDRIKNRIFEKFYRAENEETRSKKGTGLGLYIVKQLVELNKGTIHIEDNQPTGSTFIVKLPLK